ncbi:MAG TPA: cation:dicarboxylase symporter family transporter, partial [Chromatiales bacterium]|nr:cation:dicarboxylase symporter family transporter [Chromatiales bacterium]
MLKLKLHWQILIALGLAVLAGILTAPDSGLFGIRYYDVYNFIGTAFLNALKMIIVPLIISSIIVGIAGVGGVAGLGRLGGMTFLYYMVTSLLAILTGLVLVNLFTPGIIDGQPAQAILGLDSQQAAIAVEKVGARGVGDIAEVFLSMLPPNIVAAAADGQMLGLIVFSLLFGYFMTRIPDNYGAPQLTFWQGIYHTMMQITEFIMKFAPLGVFGLVAKVIA